MRSVLAVTSALSGHRSKGERLLMRTQWLCRKRSCEIWFFAGDRGHPAEAAVKAEQIGEAPALHVGDVIAVSERQLGKADVEIKGAPVAAFATKADAAQREQGQQTGPDLRTRDAVETLEGKDGLE